MNFEKARKMMVENQLRPNKVTNAEILGVFLTIQKEMFLNNDIKNIAYSDVDINLMPNRGYLKNLHLAQLIQHSNIKKDDTVLHIGALTGYVTSILSMLCNQVVAVENNEDLFNKLNNNILKLELKNIDTYKTNLELGLINKSPYDLIFIDNPLTNIPNDILDQLNPHSGRMIMIKKISDELGKGLRITKSNQNFNKEILFDCFSKFQLYETSKEFVF